MLPPDFYINGKPLIEPPESIGTLLGERLERLEVEKEQLLKLDHKPDY